MNFVETYWLSSKVCREIISWFDSGEAESYRGICGEHQVDEEIKKCEESVLGRNAYLYHSYMAELSLAIKEYGLKFNYFQAQAVDVRENTNVQKYLGGEGYYQTHTERDFLSPMRELVFMSYLNTVEPISDEVEGGTEFVYYDLKVKAEEGKTLIWPAGFTHMHRGIPHPTDTKYIVTGWLNLTG